MSDESTCFLCEESPTNDEDFCYGCKQFICGDCDVNGNIPLGGHNPENHNEEEEDEG